MATDTNTNYATYGGDLSPYLNKNFGYGQLTQLNQAMGTSAGNQPTFQQNGNIYQVKDNGNNTFSLQQIDTIGNRQNEQNQANENTFNTNLTNTVNSLPTPTDTYNTLANTLGITGTQTALTSAEKNLNMIPTNVQANATSMGGISAPQIAARENQQSGLISPVVQSLASTLGIENQNLGTLFAGQEEQNQQKLLPFQYQAQFLGQNAQNAFTMMDQEQQNSFTQAMIPLETQATITEEQAQQAIDNAAKLSYLTSATTNINNGTINPALLESLNPYSLMYNQMGLGGASGGSGGSGSGTGSGYTFG